MMSENLFERTFGRPSAATGWAAGRVNLIGEHTDYNGGFVLPTTLPLGVRAGIAPISSHEDEVFSGRFEKLSRRQTNERASGAWSDYVVGALQAAREAGWIDDPMQVAISSDLPDGVGLSSSAATVIAVLKAVLSLRGRTIAPMELAKIAQHVENDFIGVPCGIMDQAVIALNAKDTAILLDTETLDYKTIDIPLTWRFAIVDTGIKRKLNDGRYAERRGECERAAHMLGTDTLCRISEDQIKAIATLPGTEAKRARHAHTEQSRTIEAVTALEAGDLLKMGDVMNRGHWSLSTDFEVSTPEIDALVAEAVRAGAAGARLTGGGFGGSIVAVIAEDRFASWQAKLTRKFQDARVVCCLGGVPEN
ncbi:MAG: galactokinase [Pseudomonadota bacterium]